MSNNLLITGATGNIGQSVLAYLTEDPSYKITVGVRSVDKAKNVLNDHNISRYMTLDLEKEGSYKDHFKNIDIVFLLRPPHISNSKKYFEPFLSSLKADGVKGIVFLSVQGVEKSKIIPHHKIESLIQIFGFDYIFLRPSYFMQNITTTLWEEILTEHKISLPSGNARFNWVDVDNIGEAGALLLKNFENYKNNAYEITGKENLNFHEVKAVFREAINKKITYQRINPIKFYLKNLKKGHSFSFTNVKFMLHFLPRFESEPRISDFYKNLTGKEPTSLKQFLLREKSKFQFLENIKN